MLEKLNAKQIRDRITNNHYGRAEDEGGDEWDYQLAELFGTEDIDAVIAWTHFHEQQKTGAAFYAHEIAEVFQEEHKGEWETAATFAAWVAEDEAEMGDEEESKGRQWMLEKYGQYIDWQAFAGSPELAGTYSLIMLDPENSRVVHAFKIDD